MERKEIPRYVTDASVIVKWFVQEEDTPQSLRLKELFEHGKVHLEAPSLLGYEVASALRFHPKIKITLKQYNAVAGALDRLQITREPNDQEWTTAFRLSLENPISIYDAIYIAFAISGRSKMVTADRSLHSKLRSAGVEKTIITLRDLSL